MKRLQTLLKEYQKKPVTIGVLGSHSALEVCSGAKKQGFKTLVVAQKGREKTYDRYYKTQETLGCVDACLTLPRFADILKEQTQQELLKRRVIFIPHRSFEVYLNHDYQAIEKKFRVPIFGNRYLLKMEERDRHPNQYDWLKTAGIRFPRQFTDPQTIDRLVLVKVQESERSFERAFFLAKSEAEFKRESQKRLKQGLITKRQLSAAVIEEFIVGVQVNFHFFYSPLKRGVELLGTDTRRQTNWEGISRVPSAWQDLILNQVSLKFEEAGHIATTVLESLLEPAFLLAERLVKASQKLYPPGIIGPFALQTIVTPGPPAKEIIVVDVSPRMPGSPGISSTPYSHYWFRQSLSMGERVGMEIKEAWKTRALAKILT